MFEIHLNKMPAGRDGSDDENDLQPNLVISLRQA